MNGGMLKFRKGMKEAGEPEEVDRVVFPVPQAGYSSVMKPFTAEDKKAQAMKLAEILRKRGN
jgi:hypothetical protein